MALKTEELKKEEQEKFVSKDFPEYIREHVNDPGIDEMVKELTPEKIQKAYNSVFGTISSKIKAYIETCMHCGLCDIACHHYLSHDKDPTYAPVGKVKMTLWKLMEKKGNVSPEFIKQCARIAFTECNMCHRCSMYCPFGIEIAFLIGLVRRMCLLLRVVPRILMDYNYSLAATLTQLWIPQGDWIDVLQWQESEIASEIEKAQIPFDKEGVEYLYVTLGTEPKVAPHFIATMAKIMNYAGVDWSFSTKDYANMSMFVQDRATMQRIVRAVYDDAFRLRAKKIVVSAGKLKIDKNKKIKEPVTLQDPCNLNYEETIPFQRDYF